MRSKQQYRFIHNVVLDCCIFHLDAFGDAENNALMQIFEWKESGIVIPLTPYSITKEIENKNTPFEVRRLASDCIYTKEVSLTNEQLFKLGKIKKIIIGEGKAENYENDALNIFLAQEEGGYFLTLDNRLIAKRELIRSVADIHICSPSEFISIVKKDQELGKRRKTQGS